MINILPIDIQYKVFSHFDVKDLPYLSLVDKFYYTLLAPYRLFGPSPCPYLQLRTYLNLELAEDKDNYALVGTDIDHLMDKVKLMNIPALAFLSQGIYRFSCTSIGGQLFSSLHKNLPPSNGLELILNWKSTARINWDAVSDSALDRITKIKLCGESRNATNVLGHLTRMTNLEEVLVEGIDETQDLKTLWDIIFNVLRNTKAKGLEIANNPNVNQCSQLLASMLPSSNLEYLTIYSCDVDDEFVQTIANVLPNCRLEALNFQDNATISESGYTALSHALAKSKLTILNIAWNFLTEADIRLLSKSLEHSKITELFITEDEMEDSMYPLYSNLENLHLTWLEVSQIGPESEKALIRSLAKSKLESIDIQISLGNLGNFMEAAKQSKLKKIEFKFDDYVQERMDILSKYINDTPVKNICIIKECSETYVVDCFALFNNLTKESALQQIDLSGIELDKDQLTLLFIQLPFTNITSFRINCPKMTEKELDKLIPGINLSSLAYLYLGGRPKLPGSAVVRFVSRLNNRKFRKLVITGSKVNREAKRAIRRLLGDSPMFFIEYG
ncbi:hypothetical protein HDV01_002958 [Terramyces sp. JEL0728]|nr:hypothetical protein HDV01_002958 [Terramyces sp. JEL0728]